MTTWADGSTSAKAASALEAQFYSGAINAFQYGVRSDGATPSAAFLQNAVNAAANLNCGKVIVPGRTGPTLPPILMESKVILPNGISVVGNSRRGTVFRAISGTFPTSTPMFQFGSGEDVFDTRLESLGIDMQDIAGSSCVYGSHLQEGSGLRDVGAYSFKSVGALFELSQNFEHRALEFYSSTSGSVPLALRHNNCIAFGVTMGTFNTFNTTTGVGVQMENCYQFDCTRMHTEQNLYGLECKSSFGTFIDCTSSGDTTVYHFDSGSYGNVVIGSSGSGATNHIIDDNNGATITTSQADQIGLYVQTRSLPHSDVQPNTYSTSITPIPKNSPNQRITATNGTAFTINAPGLSVKGMEMTIDILNSSGGALGAITWNSIFKLAGAFTNPANTKRRTISFYFDGSDWVEKNRAAADI